MAKWTGTLLALFLAPTLSAAQNDLVLVTGATGRTGSIVYKMLKSQNVPVRGLVRNVTKARDMLGCTKCDESEGIFVGDLTQPETLTASMLGTTKLVVATSAAPICTDPSSLSTCHYPKGALPVDIDWNGGKAQLTAFATQAKGKGFVAMISSMGTTEPDGFLEKLDNGHIGFYKLNMEAFIMSSGLDFTIIKPCGLDYGAADNSTLVTGHDDELKLTPPTITRENVARLIVASLQHPDVAAGLRFDVCSKAGSATTDLLGVLQDAKYPWDKKLGDASADLQI